MEPEGQQSAPDAGEPASANVESGSASWPLRLSVATWLLAFCCTFGGPHRPEPGERPDETHKILVIRAALAMFPSVVALVAFSLGTHSLLRGRERRGAAIGAVALAVLYLGLVWGVGPILLPR